MLGQTDKLENKQELEVTHSIVYYPTNGHELVQYGADPKLLGGTITPEYFAVDAEAVTNDKATDG
jgi:hypothetical protein